MRKSPTHIITCALRSHASKPKTMDAAAREFVNSLHQTSLHHQQRYGHIFSHHVLVAMSPTSVGLISMLLIKSSCVLGSTTLPSIRWFAGLLAFLVCYNLRYCFSIIFVFLALYTIQLWFMIIAFQNIILWYICNDLFAMAYIRQIPFQWRIPLVLWLSMCPSHTWHPCGCPAAPPRTTVRRRRFTSPDASLEASDSEGSGGTFR